MTLEAQVNLLATDIGNELQTTNGNVAARAAEIGTIGNLNTTATDLVAAVNEVLLSAGVTINDAATNATDAWSSNKIAAEILALIDDVAVSGAAKTWSIDQLIAYVAAEIAADRADLVGSAPATLDAIDEISTALQNNPNIVTDILTAQGLRVRVDAAQSLTTPQQTQGRNNIGAQEAAEIGDTAADFVATFQTALTT